jgi:hypothetical protein
LLTVNPDFIVIDPPVVEAVERQLVIGLPAVGVDERFQLGLALGGDALANDTIILGDRIGMDADLLGRPGCGYFKSKQLGDQFTLFL